MKLKKKPNKNFEKINGYQLCQNLGLLNDEFLNTLAAINSFVDNEKIDFEQN